MLDIAQSGYGGILQSGCDNDFEPPGPSAFRLVRLSPRMEPNLRLMGPAIFAYLVNSPILVDIDIEMGQGFSPFRVVYLLSDVTAFCLTGRRMPQPRFISETPENKPIDYVLTIEVALSP